MWGYSCKPASETVTPSARTSYRTRSVKTCVHGAFSSVQVPFLIPRGGDVYSFHGFSEVPQVLDAVWVLVKAIWLFLTAAGEGTMKRAKQEYKSI